ncbi:hypothetical protein [Aliiglaciecola litoralis]|uniref:BNR repeat-like domain-containing protein n=1 Tax=Aliiglaciecola litoralis TaxID=582857 RepID=A0ABP3WY87_9ALTE
MNRPSLLIFISTLFSVVLLNGCASTVNVAPRLSEQSNVNQQEGILLARVVNATSYKLPFNQLFIAPKEVNASKEVKTVLAYAEDRPVGGASVFAVSLKPGEYSISSVRSFIFRGEFYFSRGTGSDPEFGTFKVEAGKVTDLGTMVYYPKPLDDRYTDILVRVPETAQGTILENYFPNLAEQHQDVLTWDADERDEQRFLMYASIAQNPIDFTDIIAAPDGSIYMLSKLGVILRYDTNNGFETLAVDTDLSLSSFAQNQSGDRLVGGHEGALFYQPANGEWHAIQIPAKASVHHVGFYQENQFDVVYSEEEQVVVARFDKQNLSQPQTINQYNYVDEWANAEPQEVPKNRAASSSKRKPRRIDSVWLSDAGAQKRINVSSYIDGQWSAFESGKIETYSYNPDTWKMGPADEETQMDVILDAGAMTLGIEQAGFWSWSGTPTYYVRASDNDQWQKLDPRVRYCKDGSEIRGGVQCFEGRKPTKPQSDRFSFLSSPWFWDAQNGLAIVSFSDYSFWSGQRSTETKILITDNGGQNWKVSELTLPKEYCTTIIGQVKSRILLSCDGATTDFYESTDHGQSWQHIRQQQAF